MPEDPPVDDRPVLYRPGTFSRHLDAVEYVEGLIRTRAPLPGTGRFASNKPGAWGLLASGDSISAGSGLTLGTGTVSLLTRDGSTLTDSGVSVTVYNNGAAITTEAYSYGGRVVPLEWTEAGWSACECKGSCLVTVNTLACAGRTVGSTVNWWTDSGETGLIVTGVGNTPLDVGSAGTWYREIIPASARLATSTASVAVECGDVQDVTLSPADGYHCWANCAVPIADTLVLTSGGVAYTITWDGSAGWAGMVGLGEFYLPADGSPPTFGGSFVPWTSFVCFPLRITRSVGAPLFPYVITE